MLDLKDSGLKSGWQRVNAAFGSAALWHIQFFNMSIVILKRPNPLTIVAVSDAFSIKGTVMEERDASWSFQIKTDVILGWYVSFMSRRLGIHSAKRGFAHVFMRLLSTKIVSQWKGRLQRIISMCLFYCIRHTYYVHQIVLLGFNFAEQFYHARAQPTGPCRLYYLVYCVMVVVNKSSRTVLVKTALQSCNPLT